MVPVVVPAYFSRLVFRTPPRDLHDVHQALWRAFHGPSREFLFRADVTRAEGATRMKVLVQARAEAAWEKLGATLEAAEQLHRALRLQPGEQLRFFLRANPTASRKGRSEPAFEGVEGEAFREARGRRVALFGEERQRQWLARKAEVAGFNVLDVRLSNSRPWRWADSGRAVHHDGVDFDGILEVRDANRLAAALQQGIGPAKAFGFGLLSLARELG